MRVVRIVLISGLALIVATVGFVYSGVYPIGADVPHNWLAFQLLETLRENSIERASKAIETPSLDDPELLLSGGPDYNEMCASCHLQPGQSQSDMSVGLYPAPPNLSKPHGEGIDDHEYGGTEQAARRHFWIIKHGIKASGMPAWGTTHDDDRIWAMVAFIQKLPDLTPVQYQILTARDDATSHH